MTVAPFDKSRCGIVSAAHAGSGWRICACPRRISNCWGAREVFIQNSGQTESDTIN